MQRQLPTINIDSINLYVKPEYNLKKPFIGIVITKFVNISNNIYIVVGG